MKNLLRSKKFKVLISETALKALTQLNSNLASRIKSTLKELENNPFQPRPNSDIKKLHGYKDPELYRLRIGKWRAVYFIVGEEVRVTEIFLRGKGYEWID